MASFLYMSVKHVVVVICLKADENLTLILQKSTERKSNLAEDDDDGRFYRQTFPLHC